MGKRGLAGFWVLAALLTAALPVRAGDSMFDEAEPVVTASPATGAVLKLDRGERVVDFDVSPIRPEAALIIRAESGREHILFWEIGSGKSEHDSRAIEVPAGLALGAIAWHPAGNALFLTGRSAAGQQILKIPADKWSPVTLYQAKTPIQRLVVGPRRFGGDYRVFFATRKKDGTWATHSITESGGREYIVLGSSGMEQLAFPDAEQPPEILYAQSALPEIFHPAGNIMLWEDGEHCFHKATYAGDHWADTSSVVYAGKVCGGSLTYTPNGAFMLHWRHGAAGVELIGDHGAKTVTVAQDKRFLSTPSSVADGRGIVGVVDDGSSAPSLEYVPLQVPLANVVNAWMFLDSPEDEPRFTKNGGLFRPIGIDELYQLYDTESYAACGGVDSSKPARPYYVTTDIFWELYASAFEGVFVLSERRAAIPHFWAFVTRANAALKHDPGSRMAKAFAALEAVRKGRRSNPEAARILAAKGGAKSSVTGEDFDYGNLQPRSHYTMDQELETYFKASKYLMDLTLRDEDVDALHNLPQPVINEALAWIKVYAVFLAPSRRPQMWGAAGTFPAYMAHTENVPQVFPLSWGIDNETLLATMYQDYFPPQERIEGPEGHRQLPSGVDVAAVLGSKVAWAVLKESGEFAKYPPLEPVLSKLQKRYQESRAGADDTLYQKWMNALAAQWSEGLSSPDGTINEDLWARKRLQTGLASWASLRHTTLLVNERPSGAECGESGFEELDSRPPRGYVEPDPQTLDGIANLFDATIEAVKQIGAGWKGEGPGDGTTPGNKGERLSVQAAVIRRLAESRDNIRYFSAIARKEIDGKPLSASEYEAILYVGRAAEHNFLIFRSLGTKDFALQQPQPVAKVADVAFRTMTHSLLLAGVGNPLEWDQIVPYYGRREMVKGATYSYYEAVSPTPMSDRQWREFIKDKPPLPWFAPYSSSKPLSCPIPAP